MNRKNRSYVLSSASLSLSLLLTYPKVVHAQSVWNGAGANANWSTAANWSGTSPIPGVGTNLSFGGTNKLTPQNDFPTGSNFGSLAFAPGAGSFTLVGNSLVLNGNITNNSSNVQLIGLPLILNTSNRSLATGTAGVLFTVGPVGVAATRSLVCDGGPVSLGGTWDNNNAFFNFTINSGSLIFADGANITMGSSSSATDLITINGGAEMTLSAGRSFTGRSSLKVGNANTPMSANAVLNQTGGTLTLATSVNTGQARMTLGDASGGGGIAVFNMSGGTLNIPGTGPFDGLFIGVRNSATVNISGGAAVVQRIWMGGTGSILNAETSRELNLSGGSVTVPNIFNIGVGNTLSGERRNTIRLAGGAVLSTVAFSGGDVGTSVWNNTLILNGGNLRLLGAGVDGGQLSNFLGNFDTVKIQPGGVVFDSNGIEASITQALLSDATASGGGVTKIGAGGVRLAGVSTYTGATVINAGALALLGPGSINQSAVIVIATGASLDVSGAAATPTRNQSTLGLVAGQTLTGTGSVIGSVAVSPEATLSPGSNGIGTLNVFGSLTLGGTTQIDINRAGTPNCDLIAGMNLVNFGGSLHVANQGDPLQAGDSFLIFSANAYTLSFTSINLPPLSPGLSWSTSDLSVNGRISVVPSLPVTINGFSPTSGSAGTIITITGSGFHADRPDDHNITLNYNGQLVAIECLSATGTTLTGRLGEIPPSSHDHLHTVEVRVGTGERLNLISTVPGLTLGSRSIWSWSGNPGPAQTATATGTLRGFSQFFPNNFDSGPPQNGQLQLRIGQDWQAGMRYCFTGFMAVQGANVATRVDSLVFALNGTRMQCATNLCGIIKQLFASNPRIPLDLNCNVTDDNGVAVITVSMANGAAIFDGDLLLTKEQLDLKADAIEIVQASQDLTNSVRLIEDRQTFVRGYAHIAQSTCGPYILFPQARLRGWRNGNPIPGFLTPINAPFIDLNGNLDQLRPDKNRSFLFSLPLSWMQPGLLTLTMTVDPNGAIPETGSLANNSVSVNGTVYHKGDPCLVLVPIWTTGPTYTGADLPQIIDRAKSLMPVHGFQLRSDNNLIRKPYVKVHIEVKITFHTSRPFVRVRNCSVFDAGYEPYDLSKFSNLAVALAAVEVRRLLSGKPGGCADAHWVGTVHPSAGSSYSIAVPWGRSVIVIMSGGTSIPYPWNAPGGGHTLAHELGHNYGRGHILQSGVGGNCNGGGILDGVGPPYDFSYPYDHCTIGPETGLTAIYGFDPISQTVIGPRAAGELMTYASRSWISKYNWDNMWSQSPSFAFAPAAPVALAVEGAAAPTSFMLVHGIISGDDGVAEFEPFYTLDANSIDPQNLAESLAKYSQLPPEYPVQLRFLNQQGSTLATVPLAKLEGAGGSEATFGFSQFIPTVPLARRLQLLNNGIVLTEREISPNPPTISLMSPVLNASDETLQLSWTATDPDEQPLFFIVQYSADNGLSWRVLDADYPYLNLTLDARKLPGGAQCKVRVIATDGVNSSTATSAAFTVPTHAPEPQIGAVREGECVRYGSPLQLSGLALDAEDGSIPPSQLAWTLNGSAMTESGSALSLPFLAPGPHVATLSATDSQALSATVTRHFEICPVQVPEGDTPVLDGMPADEGYRNASQAWMPLDGGQAVPARILHSGGALFICFNDVPFQSAVPGGTRVGLRIDVDKSRHAQAQVGDVGFYVDETGALQALAGNGTEMVPISLPPGFSAAVVRGTNSWSAELKISDSLIGGTNHDAGLMLSYESSLPANGNIQWPPLAGANQPSSWAPVVFGTVPSAVNLPPIASAQGGRILNAAQVEDVHLDGSASFDPEGSPLAFTWTQVEGPTVVLSDAASPTPHFVAVSSPAPVTLRFQLVVNDGQLPSIASTTTVTLMPASKQPSISKDLQGRMELVDGSFIWNVFGQPGRFYRVEASTNLVDWETIQRQSMDIYGWREFKDPVIPNYPKRFYRGVQE